ncbi:bifunctional glutamate/proline--tRNA ligase [Polistes fuscatus]|uniref:bifunctional glutamate/proline--tRNA ligase n=1 Tax=Polistes fuscatus TaxID=30207 RepID=UPI001CA91A57|nr:bifunctional glutamate/proline--tRNA ligase [Polistes fuscatus]
MMLKLKVNSNNPPTDALITAELINCENKEIDVVWCNDWKEDGNLKLLDSNDRLLAKSGNEVARYIGRTIAKDLYGNLDIRGRTEVDHWLSFAIGPLCQIPVKNETFSYLNKILMTNTWLANKKFTVADISVFCALLSLSYLEKYEKLYPCVTRWYKQMLSFPAVTQALSSIEDNKIKIENNIQVEDTMNKKVGVRKQEGKFIDLPGAEMGKVVVRFPPEASGYLHIGHAKAALLNQYYAETFKGQLIMRFDDTNPAKENLEFEEAILEDIRLLNIKPDRFTYSSDYFDLMLDYCTKLIKDGKAFVDDTPALLMKEQRDQKLKSANRDNSVEKNLELWNEMQKGSKKGQECCVRAKIDYESVNGCLRDPTIYRCKPEPHPRTGTKYKVYPIYDFACPIVDAIENVTHTLRTTEYHDRDIQYYWIIEALGLNRPYIWEYSRLNMTNTVLSKRKLTWFVENGLVDGWDDPRFPTVRGILRRGMTVEGLKQFIIAQGSSRSVVFMEWDKIWSFNKKVIDPIAIRYTALDYDNTVPVNVLNSKEEWVTVRNHPKDPSLGTKRVRVGSKLLIEKDDAEALIEGQNATFVNWGNLKIEAIHKKNGSIESVDARLNLSDENYKNTLKITWLPAPQNSKDLIPCYAVYFDHIISKPILGKDDDFKDFVAKDTRVEIRMLGESELNRVKKGEIIQLQRKGFFRCDIPYADRSPFCCKEQPLILFHIPDGHTASKSVKTSAVDSKGSTVDNKPSVSKAGSKGNAVYNKPSLPKIEQEDVNIINDKIIAQGHIVRHFKSEKADQFIIDAEVKTLLKLKADFKAATGKEWKPKSSSNETIDKVEYENTIKQLLTLMLNAKMAEVTQKKNTNTKETNVNHTVNNADILKNKSDIVSENKTNDKLSEEIQKQGDKVRQLKSEKASKDVIDREVKVLLNLKSEYKTATGQEWKPMKSEQNNATIKSTETKSNDKLSEEIQKQGDKVRQLKSEKASKDVIDREVKVLLNLKSEYKTATGQEWKPMKSEQTNATIKSTETKSNDKLSEEIQKQGDKVRQLKSEKASKDVIDREVKVLLNLKSEYKTATGQEWKPMKSEQTNATIKSTETKSNDKLSEEIQKQGDKVRQLKSEKASKDVIDREVKVLLNLKSEYKTATGQEWKPMKSEQTNATIKSTETKSNDKLSEEIQKQGDKVRQLKSEKASKDVIDREVKVLLNLKSEYKTATGQEWKPMKPEQTNTTTESTENKINDKLFEEIQKQDDKVRQLKSTETEQSIIDKEVKILLSLKNDYKIITGFDWKSKNETTPKKKKKDESAKSGKKADKNVTNNETKSKDVDSIKTGTRLGLEAQKEENFADWYSQVITKSGMIEYYDVSGCYILRPWSFLIWKAIKEYFDKQITKLGIQECYFPMFVTRAALEKEKAHIADFAPEVAWVTRCGDSDMAEHIAIRPTSETVMYPAYSKWIRSDTELPLRLNQWSNVVRWEFKDPKPFLRTREFLWQEGHTVFANKKDAEEEVLVILDMYAKVYQDLLAVPVIKGRKTEKEKFAGSDYTTTVEAFISTSGRAIQGATSHHLGQNFSKMFNIQIEGAVEGEEKTYVYQNSWGLTTRTIGVMIMVHGDDKGLVLPPNVASIQAVIVPCGITATTTLQQREQLMSECLKLENDLSKDESLRIKSDYRNNRTPGWKFNHWELKGVPVRIELGPKDLEKNQVTFVRRDNCQKMTASREEAVVFLRNLLNEIQSSMLNKAKKTLDDHIKKVEEWALFIVELNKKNLLLSPFCGEVSCEDNIKADSARDDGGEEAGALSMGAKSLCIPFEQPQTSIPLYNLKCIHPSCKNKPKFYTLFGRSY